MKTLVYGLGESGIAATRALLERGAEVLAADANEGPRLQEAATELGGDVRLGAGPEVLKGVHRVVVSPGVRPGDPVLRAAEERGIPVLSEIGLGLELLGDGVGVAAVTGTNGKTTVVGMLGGVLGSAGMANVLAGNSWRALTGCLEEVRSAGLLVLEVSSFQLHYTGEPGFRIAALLNARPDHLDWHSSLDEYRRDKLRVFEGQGEGDLALVSAADPVGRGAVPNLAGEALVVGEGGTAVRDGRLYLHGSALASVDELCFAGIHNYENALFAAAAAERLGVGVEEIRAGLLDYRLGGHRLERVAEVGGVTYVDDSKATNPSAVAAALYGIARPVVLILGGSEKHTDFSEILPHLSRCRAVLCQGEAGPRIAAFLEREGHGAGVERLGDLESATRRAAAVSRPGDVVLLSPGCASFDQFAGYAERGEAFARFAGELADRQGVAGL